MLLPGETRRGHFKKIKKMLKRATCWIKGHDWFRYQCGLLSCQRCGLHDFIKKDTEMNPWETKWSKKPAQELIQRLSEIGGELMTATEPEGVEYPEDLRTDEQIHMLGSEAHWIAEELEHRINKTEWAGVHDISTDTKTTGCANCHRCDKVIEDPDARDEMMD